MVNHIERKGVGEVHLHPRQSAKCFASLTATEQKLLLHNMLGAFQSEAIKAKWDSHSDATCPLCQEVDSRTHRVLYCPALLEVRQTFPEAIQIISDQRQDWVYFPLAQAYPHQHVLETLLNLIPPTDVPEPVDISREVVSFFTDGGALHTTDSRARIAGFSVVQDIGTSEGAFQQTADYAFSSPPRFPSFKTLCAGIVPGRQNVPRAELYAFTLALQASERCAMASSIRFVTDAKYVCDIIKKIQSQDPSLNGPSITNADLVNVIREHWNPERHHIVKIKSHRSFSSAVDIEDLFLILGNHCADVAVSAALQAIPSILKEAAQACVDHHALEQSMLTKVMQYLLALNRKRTFLLKQPSSIPGLPAPLPPEPTSLMPKHLFGLDAISFLSQYAPSDYIPWVSDPIPHEDVLQACQQGTRLAHAMISWCLSLKWPADLDSTFRSSEDWGISWFELWVNFYITTGYTFPIRISGLGAQSVYLEYFSPDAQMQPAARRAVYSQAFVFQKALSQLCTMTSIRWFPSFKTAVCCSMKHLNYTGKAAGIPCRPVILQPDITMTHVSKFLSSLEGKHSLAAPFPNLHIQPILNAPEYVEIPVSERFKKYNRIYQSQWMFKMYGNLNGQQLLQLGSEEALDFLQRSDGNDAWNDDGSGSWGSQAAGRGAAWATGGAPKQSSVVSRGWSLLAPP
eukprot:Skav202511  [mRNA]  locus=scaffold1359:161060:165608:- [translate_table: standard]